MNEKINSTPTIDQCDVNPENNINSEINSKENINITTSVICNDNTNIKTNDRFSVELNLT